MIFEKEKAIFHPNGISGAVSKARALNMIRGTSRMDLGNGWYTNSTFRYTGSSGGVLTAHPVEKSSSEATLFAQTDGIINYVTISNSTSGSLNTMGLCQDKVPYFKIGETYTMSAWMKASYAGMSAYFQPIWDPAANGGQGGQGASDVDDSSIHTKTFTVSTEWQLYSWVFKVTSRTEDTVSAAYVYASNAPAGSQLSVCGIQIKKGHVVYDYTDDDSLECVTVIDGHGIRVHPTDTEDNSAVINSDGLKIYKGGTTDSSLVATFGENIRFSSSKAQYIGSDNAYMIFTPGNNLLSIGGNVKFNGDVPLSTALSKIDESYNQTHAYDIAGVGTYWMKLGTMISASAANSVIELFSGNGYNGSSDQNSKIRIHIKTGNGNPSTNDKFFGVEVEHDNAPNAKVAVIVDSETVNTQTRDANNQKCHVWVYLPWQYHAGHYTVRGNYKSWTHSGTSGGTDPDTYPSGVCQDTVYRLWLDNYMTFTSSDGLTIGATGYNSKVNIKSDAIKLFDNQGNQRVAISSANGVVLGRTDNADSGSIRSRVQVTDTAIRFIARNDSGNDTVLNEITGSGMTLKDSDGNVYASFGDDIILGRKNAGKGYVNISPTGFNLYTRYPGTSYNFSAMSIVPYATNKVRLTVNGDIVASTFNGKVYQIGTYYASNVTSDTITFSLPQAVPISNVFIICSLQDVGPGIKYSKISTDSKVTVKLTSSYNGPMRVNYCVFY